MVLFCLLECACVERVGANHPVLGPLIKLL